MTRICGREKSLQLEKELQHIRQGVHTPSRNEPGAAAPRHLFWGSGQKNTTPPLAVRRSGYPGRASRKWGGKNFWSMDVNPKRGTHGGYSQTAKTYKVHLGTSLKKGSAGAGRRSFWEKTKPGRRGGRSPGPDFGETSHPKKGGQSGQKSKSGWKNVDVARNNDLRIGRSVEPFAPVGLREKMPLPETIRRGRERSKEGKSLGRGGFRKFYHRGRSAGEKTPRRPCVPSPRGGILTKSKEGKTSESAKGKKEQAPSPSTPNRPVRAGVILMRAGGM